MSCLSATLAKLYFCIYVFVFVYLQVRHPKTLFLRSSYHHLSENIWFVWSKTSYSGDRRRCFQAGQTNKQTTMEDRATQPLGCWKAELRNIAHVMSICNFDQCCICVFVYLCIYICVFSSQTPRNIVFEVLVSSPFRKYMVCMV